MDEIASLLEPQIPALRRYAFALVRNHAAADDLVQDALERALTRWYLRRRDGDLRAWLFTILRNLFLSDLRSQRRRGSQVGIEDADGVGVAPAQEERLEMRDLFGAFDHLSEDQKSILLLIGVEDISYADTARILDIPIGTVMSRLSRARQRLRTLMDTGRTTLLRRVK